VTFALESLHLTALLEYLNLTTHDHSIKSQRGFRPETPVDLPLKIHTVSGFSLFEVVKYN